MQKRTKTNQFPCNKCHRNFNPMYYDEIPSDMFGHNSYVYYDQNKKQVMISVPNSSGYVKLCYDCISCDDLLKGKVGKPRIVKNANERKCVNCGGSNQLLLTSYYCPKCE